MHAQPSIGYVKDTGTILGRGVFASKSITPGEIIEVCPVILSTTDFNLLPIEIRRIVFNWERIAKMKNTRAIAMGYGSLYNHDNQANVRYEACGDGQFLRFIATSQIAKDQELTINYNTYSSDNEWFKTVGVELIERQA